VPTKTIADNAGVKGTVVVSKIQEKIEADPKTNFGYNALTDTYEDLVKAGVMTPAKVDRSALQNAASVAGVLLAADCLITDKPGGDDDAGGAPDMDGMGGMGGMGMGGMGGMPGMGGMGF
jgi:chaperonin GroEL